MSYPTASSIWALSLVKIYYTKHKHLEKISNFTGEQDPRFPPQTKHSFAGVLPVSGQSWDLLKHLMIFSVGLFHSISSFVCSVLFAISSIVSSSQNNLGGRAVADDISHLAGLMHRYTANSLPYHVRLCHFPRLSSSRNLHHCL